MDKGPLITVIGLIAVIVVGYGYILLKDRKIRKNGIKTIAKVIENSQIYNCALYYLNSLPITARE